MAINQKSVNSYAIDFGTSNTVIASLNSLTKEIKIVGLNNLCQQLSGSPPLIPSLLYLQNATQNKVLIGQEVVNSGLNARDDVRFFHNFKRGIGSEIQGFLPEIDNVEINFEAIGKIYLTKIIEQLKIESSEAINSLVLTVPVDSFEIYRLWLTEIFRSLEIEQIKIIDEPTAAALGYGLTNQKTLLVIDIGGGTADFSLVELEANLDNYQGVILKWGQKILGDNQAKKNRTAKVIAKVGKNLGGADLDNWLVNYFVDQQGLTPSSLLNRLVERLKIKLSTQDKATEVYFNDETLESFELSLDQQTFSKVLRYHELFPQLDELMTKMLQSARRNGVEITNIDSVVLVGGTVKIPQIQDWVSGYFPVSKIKCDRPLTAIAEGSLQILNGLEVKDFIHHSYGVRYWNRKNKRHSWHPLIKNGQPYPMSQPVTLTLGASVKDQPCIELIIGEIGSEDVVTEVYFENNQLKTRSLNSENNLVKPLNNSNEARTIANLNPPGSPGSDRIELKFQVDSQCYLRVSVKDLLTENKLLDSQILIQMR